MQRAPVVAVFNTSPDIIDLLRFAFEHAGFVFVSAMTFHLREGTVDLEQFVRQHEPDVVVYDIAPPYEENWRLIQHLSHTSALRDRPFVLTTTNRQQIADLVGSHTAIYEIVGKPYDLDQIVSAVRRALPADEQSATRH